MNARLNELILGKASFWVGLGNQESQLLRKRIDAMPITAPLYVCGLARSGTTITLEALAAHPDVASHSYADFPFVFTPYFWNRFQPKFLGRNYQERAHQDGLMVNASSPESMEELIWDHFFAHLHDPNQDNRLDANTHNAAFETFYQDHIRKLMLAKGKARYASKANYNLSRIPYLAKLFSDARFVVLLRDPVDFVESSMKQDALFTQQQQADPEKLRHTELSKHFEFGLGKRLVHFGDDALMARIQTLLADEAQQHLGWALYWKAAYGYLHDLLATSLRGQILLLPYERLCAHGAQELQRLYDFCALPDTALLIARFAPRLQPPSYYRPRLDESQRTAIREATGQLQARLAAFTAG